ncbi:hypothetical protein TPA0907_00250 [Micromonospora humidisoli]|nr:hypothetical protein TPA0907_00250 [Micromonospora sp. AKA109]
MRMLTVSPDRAGACPTITDALEIAPDDAVVSIAPGVYPESLRLDGRRVRLVAAGEPGSVIVDGRAAGRPTVACTGGEVLLQGLVVQGGDYPAVEAVGGRLRMEKCQASAGYAAAVSVRDGARIEAVEVTVTGGQHGLVVSDAGGTVEQCEIRDVTDDGIIVRLGADPTIRNCTVGAAGFRGVYVYQAARPTIERCDISGTGDAGIVVALQSSPTIVDCWVHDTRGVGIDVGRGCGGTIEGSRTEQTATPGVRIAEGAGTVFRAAEAGGRPMAGVSAGGGTVGQDERRVEELLAELDSMIGLAGVKAEVRSLIDEIQVNEWRRDAGLPVGAVSHHLIFTGAPGTGKTTVARVYGQFAQGPRGAAQRPVPGGLPRDLVGQYIGHTGREDLVGVHRGAGRGAVHRRGVHPLPGRGCRRRLRPGGDRHPGQADGGPPGPGGGDRRRVHHRDGRLPRRQLRAGVPVRQDAGVRELQPGPVVDIVGRIARTDEYLLADGLTDGLLEWFGQIERDQNFGNAREARKLLEGMRKAQSGRLRALGRMPSRDTCAPSSWTTCSPPPGDRDVAHRGAPEPAATRRPP